MGRHRKVLSRGETWPHLYHKTIAVATIETIDFGRAKSRSKNMTRLCSYSGDRWVAWPALLALEMGRSDQILKKFFVCKQGLAMLPNLVSNSWA